MLFRLPSYHDEKYAVVVQMLYIYIYIYSWVFYRALGLRPSYYAPQGPGTFVGECRELEEDETDPPAYREPHEEPVFCHRGANEGGGDIRIMVCGCVVRCLLFA